MCNSRIKKFIERNRINIFKAQYYNRYNILHTLWKKNFYFIHKIICVELIIIDVKVFKKNIFFQLYKELKKKIYCTTYKFEVSHKH